MWLFRGDLCWDCGSVVSAFDVSMLLSFVSVSVSLTLDVRPCCLLRCGSISHGPVVALLLHVAGRLLSLSLLPCVDSATALFVVWEGLDLRRDGMYSKWYCGDSVY